ncbi:cell wall integrity and stress response component 4-like [Sorghum bicolor]|uniref:cell wall integrity and stress response component 4-like n=1 Tax=Sorghum bicolor TaxID=4558 RepID=UPI000B423A11|nr:cell wall integrity and stress response component 4-like [Sorghum bicolor]|eukprot:XP_021319202.1 cell wall integrity and stress response component 4-like [Sorghum bicolor]
MAASGIQLPQIQLSGTSSIRPPTLVPQPSGFQSAPVYPAALRLYTAAPTAFTLPVTTTERLSSSVASSEQLAPSSTVLETSATATESVPASSVGLVLPAQTVTTTEPTEQTRIASPAPAVSEGHSTSSESTANGFDDAAQF